MVVEINDLVQQLLYKIHLDVNASYCQTRDTGEYWLYALVYTHRDLKNAFYRSKISGTVLELERYKVAKFCIAVYGQSMLVSDHADLRIT